MTRLRNLALSGLADSRRGLRLAAPLSMQRDHEQPMTQQAEYQRLIAAYITTREKVMKAKPRSMADLVAKARLAIEDMRHDLERDEWGWSLAHDILTSMGAKP